ncbi:MAG: HNH endonuclease [Desulfobulbaceae bacterium]|nr:HNH endonuclease [Desulfobulbaceae bacterium]
MGKDIGSPDAKGYLQIYINGKMYKTHRLAWLWMEGYFPECNIDHRDRCPGNNKWKNLRHVSQTCNMRNCKKGKNNTSGVTGVCWAKRQEKWLARIMVNRVEICLGYHSDFYSAVKARWEGEKKFDFPNCNTTSSAFKYLVDH